MYLQMPVFETVLLRGLFAASLLVSTLVFGAMLGTSSSRSPVAADGLVAASTGLIASPACMLPPDGVVCPRLPG